MNKILYITLSFLILPSTHAVCPDGKTYPVTFTFDDGPHAVLTPKVLDILKEEKVPATFFVLGERFAGGKSKAKTAYALVERAVREGHRIGSHTYSHINHPQYSAAKVRENIMKPNPLLKDYLSPVLRLPYGGGSFRSKNPATQAKNDMVMSTVKNAGFKHVGWDIDTNDWDAKKRANLLPTLLKDICRYKGGVVLFHDVHENTVNHLQEWIRAVKREGHTFHPLEKFVPEASRPLPPEACETDGPSKEVKALNREVKKVIDQIED